MGVLLFLRSLYSYVPSQGFINNVINVNVINLSRAGERGRKSVVTTQYID